MTVTGIIVAVVLVCILEWWVIRRSVTVTRITWCSHEGCTCPECGRENSCPEGGEEE